MQSSQRTVSSLILGLSQPRSSDGCVCSPNKTLAVPLLLIRGGLGGHWLASAKNCGQECHEQSNSADYKVHVQAKMKKSQS